MRDATEGRLRRNLTLALKFLAKLFGVSGIGTKVWGTRRGNGPRMTLSLYAHTWDEVHKRALPQALNPLDALLDEPDSSSEGAETI